MVLHTNFQLLDVQLTSLESLVSVRWLVGRLVGWLDVLSFIISKKDEKLHFHAPIRVLVSIRHSLVSKISFLQISINSFPFVSMYFPKHLKSAIKGRKNQFNSSLVGCFASYKSNFATVWLTFILHKCQYPPFGLLQDTAPHNFISNIDTATRCSENIALGQGEFSGRHVIYRVSHKILPIIQILKVEILLQFNFIIITEYVDQGI